MTSADFAHMARALALAQRARRLAPPNPWVGCVLVREGEVVGEGHTTRAGGPHAEIEALRVAGERARGAVAYVTLEPCSHVGRTPPCADALIQAAVARVVVAVRDPDRAAANGAERLRAAGIPVDVGTLGGDVEASLAPYLHQRRTGRAYCLVKAAASLDGRTAARDGSSRWITGPAARADVHELRADSQAVVIGSGTALADRPALTARAVITPAPSQPLRVLVDGRGRVPATGPLFDPSLAATLVLTTDSAPAARRREWEDAGAEVSVLPPGVEGGVDLPAALRDLAGRGVIQAMIEGGALLEGSFLEAGLVDHLVLYLGGLTLGPAGRALFEGASPATILDAPRWRPRGVKQLESDVRLDYAPQSGKRMRGSE